MAINMNLKVHLLELHFHKYLQYKILTITILFAYIIAILIPFLTGQLSLSNFNSMFLVAVISSIFFSIVAILINDFNYHLKRIPEELILLDKK